MEDLLQKTHTALAFGACNKKLASYAKNSIRIIKILDLVLKIRLKNITTAIEFSFVFEITLLNYVLTRSRALLEIVAFYPIIASMELIILTHQILLLLLKWVKSV